MKLTEEKVRLIDLEPGTPIRFLEREYTFQGQWNNIRTDGLPEATVLCGTMKNYYVKNHMVVSLFDEKNPYRPVQKIVHQNCEVEVLGLVKARPLLKVWNETKQARFAGWYPETSMFLGTDPEIFVESEGKILPAFEFLPSKENPLKVGGKSGNIYWDGFQGEFTVREDSCLAWVVDGTQAALKVLLGEARKKNPNASLSIKTVAEIDNELLVNGKKEHVELGCMPSINVYGTKAQLPASGRTLPIRMVGGHMHFSPDYNEEKIARSIRMLDKVLGVPSVALFANYDNPARRQYYGLAGEYRTPEWGLEYRTMSNAWMFHPAIMNIVFDLGRLAVQLSNTKEFCGFFDADDDEVQGIINSCDVEKSKKYLKRYKEPWLIAVERSKHSKTAAERAYTTFMDGADSIMSTPGDIENNWDLAREWKGHSEGEGKNWERASVILADGKKV